MSTAMILEMLLAGGFWIHYTLVLMVIGTPCLVLAGSVLGDRPALGRAADFYISKYPVLYSFTITAGIVPLLFLQVLTHRLFYQAMINLRWMALSSLLSMVLVFYAAYIARARPRWKAPLAALSLAGLGHVVIFFGALRRAILDHPTLEENYWTGGTILPVMVIFHHFGSAIVSAFLAFRGGEGTSLVRRGMWPLMFAGVFTVVREVQRWKVLPRELQPLVSFDASTGLFVFTLLAGIAALRLALRAR